MSCVPVGIPVVYHHRHREENVDTKLEHLEIWATHFACEDGSEKEGLPQARPTVLRGGARSLPPYAPWRIRSKQFNKRA